MRRFEKCASATDTTRLPQRSTEQAAGYDFYSPVSVTIGPHQWGMVRTHVKARMAADDVLLIFPRSSMGIKKHMMLSNTVGVIDSDYYNIQEANKVKAIREKIDELEEKALNEARKVILEHWDEYFDRVNPKGGHAWQLHLYKRSDFRPKGGVEET